ncbi:MAG: hypothetical protein K9I94_08605 [Bacteroidales bacterium]|nr:hypothetical protein [Bacteroidales bacterium]
MANIESDIDALTHKITLYLSEIVDLRSKVNYYKKENEKLLAENLKLKEQFEQEEPGQAGPAKENQEPEEEGPKEEEKFPWENEQPIPTMIDDYFKEPFPEAEDKPTWESRKAGGKQEEPQEKKNWKQKKSKEESSSEEKKNKVSLDDELEASTPGIDFERDENNLDADENKPPAPPEENEDKRKDEE